MWTSIYFLAPKGTHYALHTIVATFLKNNLGLLFNIRQIVSPYVPQALSPCIRETLHPHSLHKSQPAEWEWMQKREGLQRQRKSLSVFVPPLRPPLTSSSSLLFISFFPLLLSGIDSHYVQMYLCRGMVRICATWSVIFRQTNWCPFCFFALWISVF